MTFRHAAPPLALVLAALIAGCPAATTPTPSAKPSAKATAAASASKAPSTEPSKAAASTEPSKAPSTAPSTAASPATSPAASPEASMAPKEVQTTATVDITGFKFVPAELTIKKGGTVTFTNKDSAPHTVTPTGAAKFEKSGNMDQNATKTITFDTVGEQPYQCDYHTNMVGKITVVE